MVRCARWAFGVVFGVVSGASLALVAGCVSEAKDPKNDPKAVRAELTPATIEHDKWSELGYRLDWNGFPFAATTKLPEITRLVPFDDAVLAQERDSTVALLETSTGKTRWSNQLGNDNTKFVGINRDSSGNVLVSSESELFTLNTQAGTLERRERFARVVNTKPVIVGNVAVYGTSVGEVLAQFVGRNFKAWGYGANRGAIEADPVVVGENIVGVVSQAGEVTFLTPTGSVTGRAKIYEGIANDPVSDGRSMIIAGLDQSVWAFDADGSQRWRLRTPARLTGQPAVHANAVIVDIPGSGLVSIDCNTGKKRWTAKDISGSVVAVRNERLIVWNGNTAYALDAERGDVITSQSLPGFTTLVADKMVDGNLFAIATNGTVVKFAPK